MSTSILIAITTALGTAAGVFLDPAWTAPAGWLLALLLLAAFGAAARGYLAFARLFTACAFVPLSSLVATAAEQRAIHPPLRQFLEERIGGFAIESRDVERHDTPVEIEGRLMADAFATEAGASMRIDVAYASAGSCLEPTSGGVSITVLGTLAQDEISEWRAGRTVRATVLLRRPARYLDRGVPDLERMLARRGIALVGSAKSAALVRLVSRGNWLDEAAAEVRAAVRRAIDRHIAVRDRQAGAIAVAILIGDRGGLDPLVEQRLQQAGTYHVIAISGGNIAVLAGVIIAMLWAWRIRGGWAAGAAIVLLAAYAYVAGGGSSVIRATVMAAIYLGLRIIDQKTAPRHAIAVTLVAVLIAAPLSIADVGLWLTFGATIAIVVSARFVPASMPAWLKAVAMTLAASMAAEIALIPIAAAVFQRVTVAGLAVNFAAIPSMAVVQIAAMVTAAADAIGMTSIAGLAGWVSYLGVAVLVGSARLVDVFPFLTWRVAPPLLILVAGYYAVLTAGIVNARRPRLFAAAAAVFLWFIVAPPAMFAQAFGDGKLHLTVLDVGQGDAMLVTLPNGRHLMIDTGGVSLSGEFDIGDRVIGPALRARGVVQLDYLAITHGDPDHIGGAASLVRDFHPREIWYGTYVNNHEPSMRLQSLAVRQRAAWRWLQAGDRMEIGGVEIRVHHPSVADWQRQKVRNDDSLVIELRYGQVSMLLTGDISKEVEQYLLPSLQLLPIVVLKAPHHGSATSSSEAFVRQLQPRLVVISCGRANPYGHPVRDVLARYQQAGTQVLRTDQDGQIEVITGGSTLSWRTFTGATN